MKICTKCKIEKKLEEFNKDSSKSDGIYSSCKQCNVRNEYFNSRKLQKSKYDRLRYDLNREKIKIDSNTRYHKNKKRYNKSSVQNTNSDPIRKLKSSLRKRINKIIRGDLKGGSAIKDLGCSVEFLKQYLESKFQPGMNWNNRGFGKNKWQLDHIVPLFSFDLSKKEDFLKACHYTNLQPIWYENHIQKTKNDVRNYKCKF